MGPFHRGFHEIGGFSGLLEKYPQAVPTNVSAIVVNTTCHWPDRNAFRMLRDVDDDYMPWLGFLLGQTPSSIWYWCNDQVLVQRALAAKSLSHAQGATLLAGFIKILPLFIMVMPGMISRVLIQSRAGCSNIAYPRLVLGLLPDGARGLMMAVMIAALMSDLDSIFNSASTLFTMDIWRKFRKHASNTELMVVGSYCGQASGQAPDILGKFHYMYFALFITVMTAVVAVLHKTTYWTRHDDLVPDDTDLDLETMENDRVRGQVSGKEDGDKEKTNLEARNSEGATRVDVIDTHKHYERTNRCRDFFYNVFCGIHASSEEEEKNVSAMKKHLQDLAALKQSRTARVALDVGLVLAMWRSNRGTASGYFLAGRSMVFLPTYTMPEYLSKRFGGQRLRVYFAFLSLVLYIFTKCSGDLYTGALFIQQSLNWDLYLSIVILVLLTAILTMTGGLTAVIYTDTLQAFLMLGGAIYLMAEGFKKVGGFSGLLEKYPQAVPTNVSAIVVNTTCHWPDRNAFRMLRDVDDDYMPWLGFLLGQTPGSIWYWCADQVIVQRALAARSLSHAQGATLMAGFIKILPMFIMVMPGMISRVLYPDEVACTNPDYCMEVCQSKAGCSNIAFPRLVLGLMPDGARGLMMAVMIAALMSDLDSIFNSASTLFTMDIWRKFRKSAKSTELMVVGRLFILVMVGVSIAWVPVIKETNRGQVFIYIQEVTNYLAPPFAAIYLLAVLVPMVNEKGAFWSLMLALVTGVIRLVIAFVYKGEGYCGESKYILANFHYMYFALFITAMTALVAIVISYFTGRPEPKYLHRTTYWTRHDTQPPEMEMNSTGNGEPADFSGVVNKGYNNNDSNDNDNSQGVSTISGSHDFVSNGPGGQEKLKRFVDPEIYILKGSERPAERKRTCKDIFFQLACGLHQTSDEQEEKLMAMKQHLKDLASLKQTKTEKLILGVGLFTIMAIGVTMYIFWSVYKFDAAPFYPNNATHVLPGKGLMKTYWLIGQTDKSQSKEQGLETSSNKALRDSSLPDDNDDTAAMLVTMTTVVVRTTTMMMMVMMVVVVIVMIMRRRTSSTTTMMVMMMMVVVVTTTATTKMMMMMMMAFFFLKQMPGEIHKYAPDHIWSNKFCMQEPSKARLSKVSDVVALDSHTGLGTSTQLESRRRPKEPKALQNPLEEKFRNLLGEKLLQNRTVS
nr:hypothetical protein BaRGS_031232 [Batillaria attramentaria]